MVIDSAVLAQRGGLSRMGCLLAMMVVAVLLSACQPLYQNHGYVPTDAELALIEVGKDSRDTVAASVGRPSAQALLTEDGWFYVKSRYRSIGAMSRQEIERQVVLISFNESGVVSNVERFGQDKGRIVTLSRRMTESNVAGRSFLSQLFGNIGGIAGVLPTSGQ